MVRVLLPASSHACAWLPAQRCRRSLVKEVLLAVAFLLGSSRRKGRLQVDVSKSQNEFCCLPRTLGFNERFHCFQHSVLRWSQLDLAESGFGTGNQASAPDRSQLGPDSRSLLGSWTELLLSPRCQDAAEPCAGCSLFFEMVGGWRPLLTSIQRLPGFRERCWGLERREGNIARSE